MGFRSSILQLVALAAVVWADDPDFNVTTGNLSSWDQSDWSLTALKYVPGHFQSQLAMSNGYVGASVAAAGPFFEQVVGDTNGWPIFDQRITFSTISGFYNVQANATGFNYPWLDQYGWDSFIAGIPHPTGILFSFGSDDDVYLDATVSNSTLSNYAQKLSMKTGVVEWSYTWQPENVSASFNVSYSAIFSRLRPNVIAVKAVIEASEDVDGVATDLLDGRSAMRTWPGSKGYQQNDTSIYVSLHPSSLPDVTGWVVSIADFAGTYVGAASGSYVSSNESTIGQSFNVSLKAGQSASFYKYVGVASTDKFADAESVATQAARDAKSDGWNKLLAEHTTAWGQLMTETAVDNFTDPATGQLPDDENIKILQIASVANTYYLLQNLQPDGSGLNDNSIPVGGLASDSYAGQVFWDADTWMAPGLNLAFPDWAKQIPNLRIKLHNQSLENAVFNGWPDGSSLYSWTTGRYGNCTATGPCRDYEYHLNYDISFNLLQLRNITQNATWFSDGPEQIIFSTAMMTGTLLQFNETTGTYWLHNATDPDEYANNIDNPSYTILAAGQLLEVANSLLLEQGSSVNQTWANQSQLVTFPRAESNITLEYQTMNNSVLVKQADVVLLTYPLDYSRNYTTSDKLLDLDYVSQISWLLVGC
jgi:trehalose/maltose hydrolase-like predicted phosphorylase